MTVAKEPYALTFDQDWTLINQDCYLHDHDLHGSYFNGKDYKTKNLMNNHPYSLL